MTLAVVWRENGLIKFSPIKERINDKGSNSSSASWDEEDKEMGRLKK